MVGLCLVLAPAWSAVARERVGFTVHLDAAAGRALVVYRGPVTWPMAQNLAEIIAELPAGTRSLTLDLDSDGGSLAEAETVAARLRGRPASLALTTRIGHGKRCLSACLTIFMQGQSRLASPASVWLVHGACPAYTNLPSEGGTRRLVALLRDAGVSEAFLQYLACEGVLSRPGGLWISGYELVHRYEAGIVTELLPSFEAEPAATPPFDPGLRSR
jgi:hypothetical protein